MKTLSKFLVLLFSTIALYSQQTTTLSITPAMFQSLLRLEDGLETRLTVPLPSLGNKVAILSRFRITDAGTAFQIMTDSGIVNAPPYQSVHLKGAIQGYPNSFVVLSIFDGWAIGRITLELENSKTRDSIDSSESGIRHSASGISYSISPQSSAPYAPLIIASESLLARPAPWNCATDDSKAKDARSKESELGQATIIRSIKVALEGDNGYLADHGNNVTTATQYAEAVFAHSSSIYQRDVNVTLYIGSILIWTATDPYTGTNTNTLLTQFENYWRANRTNVDRDLAQLLSGINDIGGIANLDGICSNQNGYSVAGTNNNIVYPRTTYAWDTDVTSHEIGHNIGSPHTHSCTWAPPIDSCYFAEGNCYSTRKAVLGTIMSYCHLYTFGTELRFHSRVATLMNQKLNNANCVNTSNLLTVSAGTDSTICNGSSKKLNGTYTDGTAPVSITWSPTTNMTGSNTLTPTVSPTTTTSYVIEVRDAYNAFARDTVVVTVKPKLVLDIPASASFCRGTVLTVTATVTSGTAPITYRWTGWRIDTTTLTPSVTLIPETSTRLYLNATDANGCTAKDSLDIWVFDQVEMSLTQVDTVACNGTTIQLVSTVQKGTPPYVFTWTANGVLLPTMGSTLTTTIDTATLYRVVVRDINNCTDTAQTFIALTNQKFTLAPKTVPMPQLPACESEFEMWITVKNTGKDPIVINRVKGGKIYTTSRDLPFTLLPGVSHQMPVLCKVPPGDILDTVRVISEQCGRVETVIVSGIRDKIGVTPDTGLTTAIPKLYCATGQVRSVVFDVNNATNFDANITSVYSRWFKKNSSSITPKNLTRKSLTSVNIVLDVPAPPGAVLDTLDVHYRSTGCEGTFVVPILIETTVPDLNMPGSINFGLVSSAQGGIVTRDLNITPEIAPIQSVMVTDVTVSGPFTTTFTAPTQLDHNVPHLETVSFDPSSITQSGVIRGEVAFVLDSCSTPYKVALEVTATIVGVDDDLNNSEQVFVRAGSGSMQVKGMSGRVLLTDVRGVVVYSLNVVAGDIVDMASISNGFYALSLTDSNRTFTCSFLLMDSIIHGESRGFAIDM